MSKNVTCPTAVLLVVLCGQIPAPAQELSASETVPGNANAGTTVIRPGGEIRGAMGTQQTREKLVEHVEQLVIQSNVKKQIIDELKKDFDGTAASAIPIHVFEILLSEDSVAVADPLAAAIEDHRHKVQRTISMTLRDLAEHQKGLQEKVGEIDALATLIVSSKAASGPEIPPDELESRKRVLRTLIFHRKDKELSLEQSKEDIDFYRTELADLSRLERRLDGMSAELGAHVERVIDALNHERNTLITQDMRASQETLRSVIEVLKVGAKPDPELVTTKRNAGERRDVGIQSAVQGLAESQPPLTPEEEQLIAEELRKAQARIASNSADPES